MGIADEPDDTPGASNRATPPAGQGGGAQPDGGGGDDEAVGGEAAAVVHSDRVWWLPYAVGILVLAGYALFLTRMINKVTEDQTQWDRYLYLFGSVEALAFTAAGFFFGREVNRGRAQAAETQARQQANRAAKAEKKAAHATANGQALSKTLEMLADGAASDPAAGAPQGMAPQGFGPPVITPAVVPAAQLRGLANLAREMFPRR